MFQLLKLVLPILLLWRSQSPGYFRLTSEKFLELQVLMETYPSL